MALIMSANNKQFTYLLTWEGKTQH